ncbi:MAG: hypothetical protein A3J18_02465 [Candidatus Levybacteria bacterium RIFCSPLOWO2_02_FULL_40_18]|nr:MAG: Glycosyl transferase family 2 [Candidatus Levybacteria bacterium GW2011_GWA2_36_13]OGH21216.1 MAG: hypothetical protein A2695_01525 [Candidatus Levybacteria bacterium RIFCSPHIGHO2_01_FULL_40_83]OGH42093.1 MAG: hypothetical protein A2965_03785 [Candidatus Levybacteria bacterium RIFCSPLOWO2_01_FULL_40_96]OGH49638.1 MAG: hypothetical protein A3J18_02465 [Candidatus Levybacteria bacterium RIFCSPLOWO2_02_FULL_40_18]OGH52119.1 MAG: hypothetical protein A3H20_03955 [Candidatus Levybacteria bac
MKSLVSVLIVNWNSKENLKDCLQSLFKIDYPNYEVIIVDNGSTDDSVSWVKKNYPGVIIAKANRNLGFAGGNEFGLKHCRGKYILFLNNDTLVTKSFLTELVSFIEKDEKLAVVQPAILFHRPGESLHGKINSVGSFILNSGFLYHLNYGKEFIEKDYGESYEIYTAYGACFLANRKLVNKLGLFDPEYFAYFEETDFSHRVWLSGHKVKIYTKAVIYHKGAKTAQKLPSSFIQYHSFKNRLFTYLKNFGLVNIYKIFVPHLFICEVSSVLYLAMRRPGYTLAIQKAILWNIIKVGKLLRERRKVQEEIRKVRDADFIPKLTRKVNIRYYYYLSSGELEKYRE